MDWKKPGETSTSVRRLWAWRNGLREGPRAPCSVPALPLRALLVTRRTLVGALVAVVLGPLGPAACSKARTAEQAHARLCKAVAAADSAALFEALDQQIRWDRMTVQKSHREAYDIILSNYPEGPDRERELRRLERGATLATGRALFGVAVGRA